jgi:hypothetical protein
MLALSNKLKAKRIMSFRKSFKLPLYGLKALKINLKKLTKKICIYSFKKSLKKELNVFQKTIANYKINVIKRVHIKDIVIRNTYSLLP